MKKCKLCKIEKNEEEFWEKHRYTCKDCRNKIYFEKTCKICKVCKKKFNKNRSFCSNKCAIIGNTIKKNNGCWIWKGCKHNTGYGLMRNYETQKIEVVHRTSYREFKGEIEKGIYICHTCDDKECCNPNHLFAGTQKENMQDAAKKGLFKPPIAKKGEKHPWHKLKKNEIFKIKKMIEIGLSDALIGRFFNVSGGAITLIRKGKNWKDVIL